MRPKRRLLRRWRLSLPDKIFWRCRKSLRSAILFFLLGVLLETVSDEKSGGADDGAEGHHWILFEGEPNDSGRYRRHYGEKPNSFFMEKFFSAQTVVFRLHKKPMKKRKIIKIPPPIRIIGEDISIASITLGSPLQAAVIAPTGPNREW